MKKEVIVDSRGKVSLSFRKHIHDRYLAEEDPDGTIHLVPYSSRCRMVLRRLPEKGHDVMQALADS